MQIGDRKIGMNHRPYIIAEIGVNHDGEVSRALELTDAAADAGADAVKLQFFETDRLMSKAAKLAAYQKNAGETDPIEMLRRLELSIDEMAQVVDRAHERGIHAIVTVFSTELVEAAETLAWDAYKSASPDIVNRPLLEALMATGKPMIVSTGASTLDEVVRAVGWLDEAKDRLAVLQCVSCYPAPEEAFGGMVAIADATGLPVGYSDHTKGFIGSTAVAYGACILEKHITYDRKAKGPDHKASLWESQFQVYIASASDVVDWRETNLLVRTRYKSGGSSLESSVEIAKKIDPECSSQLWGIVHEVRQNPIEKRVLDCERDVREVSRQSVVSVCDIAPGTVITRAMLTIKRPGTGILAYELDTVVGRTASRAIEADVPMVEEDFE
jgi:N,N'-diacetyllegionaminate synthase